MVVLDHIIALSPTVHMMSESIRYCVKDTKAVLGGSWDPKTRIRTVESNRAPYKVISRLNFPATFLRRPNMFP